MQLPKQYLQNLIPVYSALEGLDEVVESFSQSFSPFRLPVEGQEEKPSAESGLGTMTFKPTNDTQTGHKTHKEHTTVGKHKHVGGMKAYTDRMHEHTCTHTQRCGKTRSDTVTQFPKPLPVVLHYITLYIQQSCSARERKACSAKQSEVSVLSLATVRDDLKYLWKKAAKRKSSQHRGESKHVESKTAKDRAGIESRRREVERPLLPCILM